VEWNLSSGRQQYRQCMYNIVVHLYNIYLLSHPNSLIPCHSMEHFYGNLVSGNNKTYLGLNVKCVMFLPDINQVCIFSTIWISTEIHPVGATLIRVDEWKDTMPIGAFCDYTWTCLKSFILMNTSIMKILVECIENPYHKQYTVTEYDGTSF
jgi:hypothetical protein